MIMVPLDEPLNPDMPIAEALTYLDERGFDLALLRLPEIWIVYRDDLAQLGQRNQERPVRTRADNPRGDRLVEHTLELGDVADRLSQDAIPLLVIGRGGPEHIVTRADFTRPAGQVGVLAVVAALDAQLDEFLQQFDAEAWDNVAEERRIQIFELIDRARTRSEEVERLSYLTLRERFELVDVLKLGARLGLDLGTQQEHGL